MIRRIRSIRILTNGPTGPARRTSKNERLRQDDREAPQCATSHALVRSLFVILSSGLQLQLGTGGPAYARHSARMSRPSAAAIASA